jgi:hypothetical protein
LQAKQVKERDAKALEYLGFDRRYPYPNVQINKMYHIVEVKKPSRNFTDFAPTGKSGSGVPGSNFLTNIDEGDHIIVRSCIP